MATPDHAGEPPPELATAGAVLRAGGRLMWRFIRRAPLAYALAATGAVAYTAAILASSLVVGWITDEVIVPVLGEGAPAGDRLRTAVLLIVGVAVWKATGIVVRRTAAGWLQFSSQTRLRKELIGHQLGLSLRWYGSRGVGDLLSVSDIDTRQATFFLAPLPFATGVLAMLVGAVAVIWVTDPWLGLLALVLLVVVTGLDLRGAWLTFAGMEEAQRRRGRLAEVAHESFDGALTVKALGRDDVEVARFSDATHHLRGQLVRVGRIWTRYRALTEGLPGVGTVVLLVVGTFRLADGMLTAGELVRVAYLLSLLSVPIRLVGYLMWDVANSVAGFRRVEQVLSVEDRVEHGATPARRDGSAAGVDVERLRFGYEPDTPVLHDLALTIRPGRTVAVVGPTGSGKSTLAMLLARLWDPDDGRIRLDDRDLRELSAGVLSAEVAYVPQEAFLFDDTVVGNVALHLEVDPQRLHQALELASADEFVAALPDGLDTHLGERGTTLSGGQRQRIALARALVRRPRLLVLDDATSAVDPSVEARILRSLKQAALPATVIVVAYRRASIMLADEVVYVEDGRIAAHGTHAELLAREPGYARLLEAYETDARDRAEERRRQRPRPPRHPQRPEGQP